MATANFVRVTLRPGIESIDVYKWYQAPIQEQSHWVPYQSTERIAEGVTVKFSVTAYTGFTLTSWRAYYADAYGDIIDLPLASITGESSWTFTMPDSLVMILCEASGDSSNAWVYPTRVTSGNFLSTGSFSTFDDFLAEFLRLASVDSVPITGLPNNAINAFRSYYNPSKVSWLRRQGYSEGDNRVGVSLFTANNDPVGGVINLDWANSCRMNTFYVVGSWDTPVTSNSVMYESTPTTYVGGLPVGWWALGDVRYTGILSNITSGYIGSTPEESLISVRYILSPEDSGEIGASAPTELNSTDPFTFTYRIKTNYDFKRLTPFALGEGATEFDIVYSLDSYDGSTRTYTFTISGIPSDGVKGINVVIEAIRLDDPNDDGGTNASDTCVGGDGTFDDSSDHVPLPAIPSGISASDSGLVTLFRPSISQIKDFGNYLWSHITEFWENLQKIFTNPMDYVIAFNIFPVTPSVGADKDIYIGNWASNIQMPPVLNQFYEFNAGTIQVKKYFGSFLDYAPNTHARIMLPFIGDRDLSVNEIMGATLHLWYRIDLLSGACVAVLNINDDVYYQWSGNCAVAIPVTGSDWSRLYSGVARTAMIGAGGLAFGFGGAATTSLITNATSGVQQANAVAQLGNAFSNIPKGISGVSLARQGVLDAMSNVGASGSQVINSRTSRSINGAMVANWIGHNMMSAVPRIQHTGDMSGAISIMGNRTPFIVLEYPNVNLPDNYKHVFGYPSNQYSTLGGLSGYTKCKAVLFESTKATDDEIEMVINALKGGVYL